MCCIVSSCHVFRIVFVVFGKVWKRAHCGCAVNIPQNLTWPFKGNRLIFHLFLPADPQAYNVNSRSDRVPTIQVDLASPQSPDSVDLMDEIARAGQQQRDEDQGLMMKPPSGPGGPNKAGGADGPREQQKLMRCLSDPGPSADEEEDEPFLP